MMIRELSDQDLELVTGAGNGTTPINITVNPHTTVENNLNIMNVTINILNSKIINSSVLSNTTFTQNIAGS